MTENGMQRQLKAILSADVKGYSKLMGEDDESTVNTITAYRKIISELIEKHQGRATTYWLNLSVLSMLSNVLLRFKKRFMPEMKHYQKTAECNSASVLTWGTSFTRVIESMVMA